MKRLLILLGIMSLTVQIYSLDFDTVVQKIGNTYEIKNSLLEVQQLEKDLLVFESPDDISFSLSPSFKAVNPEDQTFIDDLEITGSISAKIPLGLSKLEFEKVLTASDAVTFSKINAENIKSSTFIKLYRLYNDLWLLQSEEKILEARSTSFRPRNGCMSVRSS